MAIIIPSKNIYGMDNPKIIDNVVDNVTVNSNVISKDNKYNVPVHLKKYTAPWFEHAFTANYEEWTNAATVNARSGLDALVHYAGSAVGIRTHYANDVRVYIDRILKNAYISTLLTGYNKNGYANVNYSVVYKHYIGNAKINVTQYAKGGDNSDFVNDVQLTYNGDYETSQGNLPKLSVEKTTEYTNSNLQSAIISKAYVVQEDKTTLFDDNIIKNFDDTYFDCKIKDILCGVEMYKASISGNMSKDAWGGDPTSKTRNITLDGVCEKYVPIEIEITFNGNTIGINLADGSFTYGSGNKPLSLNGNELLQDNGKVGNKSLSQHLADNILQQYGNGKETATILCDINDYYSTEGEKIISTKDVNFSKMTFDIYDEVVPFISSEKGSETPMSIDFGGRAKTFVVLGRRTIYDGAPWQELHLQEFGVISPKPLNGTEGIEYIISQDGKYYICSGISTTTSREIEIASKIGFAQETALLVKEIQENAFEATDIRTVYIPETITTINGASFSDCSELTEVYFSEGLDYIDVEAFFNCQSLTSIELPDTVTYIGYDAFEWCSNARYLRLGKKLTQINDCAFYNLFNLERIDFDCEYLQYVAPDAFSSIGQSTTKLELYIGDNVSTIPQGIFGKSNDVRITNVYFGDSSKCTQIQDSAFSGCERLTSILLPQSIEEIDDYAFYRCRALQSIELPNLTNIYEGVFMECESLAYINIPDTVIDIYDFAFMSCTNLFSVKIGNSVTSIGEEAFNNCLALDNIIIPKSLKEIEYLAFNNTARLRVVYYMGTESDWNAINIASGNEYLINATRYYYSEKRPYFEGNYWHYVDGVPTIWETYVAGMLDYTINDDGTSYSVTGIGDFHGEELVIPSVFNNKVVTKIGAYAFYDKDFIIRISIPNTIIDIGGRAFSNCNNLVEIFVEDSNTKYKTENGNLYTKDMSTLVQYCIGKDSSNFDIPSGVSVIGYDAFANCSYIESVTLSVGVRSIGTNAFKECSQLEQVVIPNSVKIISPGAFQNCSNLQDIYYQGTEQEWNSISLGANWNVGVNATIHYNS